MLKWLKIIGTLKYFRMISQNHSAIDALGFAYARKKNDAILQRLFSLNDENARIATLLFRDERLSEYESRKLREMNIEIRALFQAIYPSKDFDKTFGPNGSRDPEVGN